MNYTHGALIDNWSLESVGALLDQDYYLPDINDNIQSLFSLLDMLILNDKIIYNSSYAFTWERTKSLNTIRPYLLGVTPIKETNETFTIYELGQSPNGKNQMPLIKPEKSLISDGADFYLNLSKALGIHYWPSPKRQKYIQQLFKNESNNFITILQTRIKNELNKTIINLYDNFSKSPPEILPNFGAKVLLDCDDVKSIIPTALQMRDDKTTIAFREWTKEIDHALEVGDLIKLNKAIRSVSLLLKDLLKDFSTEESSKNPEVKLQLGIQPSVSFNISLTNSILKRFFPKKMHITFLKNHVNSIIKSSNLNHQVNKLFGI